MVSLPVFDRSGAQVGSYELDPAALAPKINKQLMHDAVVMYLANKRQGSAKTKSRGEVAGSSQKMYRQKGTGRARAGTKRSGVRRGGGHIKHKQPRDFSYRLPKKALRAATRMAIASKINDERVVVIEELKLEEIKTKPVAETLAALGCDGGTTLLALEEHDNVVYRSARNIRGVTVSPVGDLNTLSVLRPRRMVVTKAGLDKIVAAATQATSHKSEAAETSEFCATEEGGEA